MARIALTMITRDESTTLRSCLESVAPHVDELIIVDTGSTDDTLDIAREFTDKVLHFDWVDDFAAARQFALDQVSEDCDWLVWADADDVVEGAEHWRSLADAAGAGCDGFIFSYDYAQDPKTGTTMTTLWRERLVRDPRAWEWSGTVHEVLIRRDERSPAFAISDQVVYRHRRPPSKNVPERNLRIIEQQIAADDAAGTPPNPRMLVYLGSELMAQGRHADAVAPLHRYLSVTDWEEEKYQAYHKLADCYRAVKMYDDAIITELKALQVRDDWADSYFGLAECYYYKQDWERVVRWFERGVGLGIPKTLLIIHPMDYRYSPKVHYAIALFHLGRVEDALKATEEALQVVPHDPHLAHNRAAYQEMLRSQKTIEAALHLASELVLHDEPLKGMEVLDRLPHTLQYHPQILDARRKTRHLMPTAFDDAAYQDFYTTNPFTPLPIEDQKEMAERIPRFSKLLELVEQESQGRYLRILDVGCNDGLLATELARRGHTVVGVDLNPVAIDGCRERATKLGVSPDQDGFSGSSFSGTATFIHGTVDDVYEDEFDVVYSFEVIEHVRDVDVLLTALVARTRDAGFLVLSTPDGVNDRAANEAKGIAPRQHLRVLTRHDLADVVSDYGEVMCNERTDDGLSFLIACVQDVSGRKVDIWCPFSYEEWGPHTLESGIGGSEEAVVHMARELHEQGYRVTVYGGFEGASKGVLYHAHDKFDPYAKHDIVVLWRTPNPVDYRIDANEVYVWMHDIPIAPEFTSKRLERIDKVFVLSQWHRDCLPNVPDEKIALSRNGVHPLAPPAEERNPLKVVWGSSPDRGLDVLLSVWPQVLEAVPEAELHCYYGFDMYDKLRRPPGFKNHVMEMVEQHESVHWHGRVGQQELWDAFSTSGIWAYPTYFDEISCITAMRAQITGAWPVVVPKAALMETVMWGTKVDVADIKEPAAQQQFADALIVELLEGIPDKTRYEMQERCREHYSWSTVASEWSELFESAAVPV